MTEVVRFGISIDKRLLTRFDSMSADKGYVNRSEAIRDLIRNALVEDQWSDGGADAVGTVTLIYDHRYSDLGDRLTEHQHSHNEAIVSTLHIHLEAHNCLEVIVLRGKAEEIRHLADSLIGTKGVKHGKFVATTTGEDLV